MREESSVYYGKEPFDLRLTVLRMIRSLPRIIGITLLGTLLFGGGYYVKNVVLDYDTAYTATSTYRVSFVDEPSKAGDYYINEMTWNTYVTSKEFLDAMLKHLDERTANADSLSFTAEKLSDMLEVKLDSDIHVPTTIVTSNIWGEALLIAKVMEETMVEDFAESNEQVAAIELIDPARGVKEVVSDVRPLRAFILSGILSFFFAVVVFLLTELSDSAVWLPATLRRRYGLTTVGTINSPELAENLGHLFDEQAKIAVYVVNDEENPMKVVADLRNKLAEDFGIKKSLQNWIAVPEYIIRLGTSEIMRKADGLLLVVKAGKRAGKHLEYELEYLKTQEIRVSAVLLWEADEWLIRKYYMLW